MVRPGNPEGIFNPPCQQLTLTSFVHLIDAEKWASLKIKLLLGITKSPFQRATQLSHDNQRVRRAEPSLLSAAVMHPFMFVGWLSRKWNISTVSASIHNTGDGSRTDAATDRGRHCLSDTYNCGFNFTHQLHHHFCGEKILLIICGCIKCLVVVSLIVAVAIFVIIVQFGRTPLTEEGEWEFHGGSHDRISWDLVFSHLWWAFDGATAVICP